jgi:acyl carrier protein
MVQAEKINPPKKETLMSNAMDLEQVRIGLKTMIKDRLDIDADEIGVNDDSLLFDEKAWGIDSVDVLDLVLGIEEVFGVSIKQDESVQKNFTSINTLAAFVVEMRSRLNAVAN